MPPTTPYSTDLGTREPLAAIRDTTERVRALTSAWSPAHFERCYAPGKWTARQLLIHLAQSEIALGNRARMGVSSPNYAAQAFDQDKWMAKESSVGGREALDAFLALAAMNRSFFEGLSSADRAAALTHPEYGTLTVDWILHQLAGHQIHHLKQLEQV